MGKFWGALWSLAWATLWTMLSWHLITGYFDPNFMRPIDEETGDPSGGVWNDWWVVTVPLAIGSIWLWAYLLSCWINNRDTNFDWVGELIEAMEDS